MIWSTKSKGVGRLSLVAGLVAAAYHLITLNQPYGPPAQTPGQPWQNLAINLGNLALEWSFTRLHASRPHPRAHRSAPSVMPITKYRYEE
jgi:hypothetical protein